MKKIIVTGISGFLGQHFVDAPRSAWDIQGIYHHHTFQEDVGNFWEVDLSDIKYTKILFDQIEPEAIIHLAAISKPAACQVAPDYSYNINVVLPTFLAQYAFTKRIPFYFTSSDLVFDGETGPYSHTDLPHPIHLYGKQKYEAERRILDIHPAAAVLRLPLLYGYTPNRTNFLIEWTHQLLQGAPITAFTDEYRSPLYVRDAVRGILQLLRRRRSGIWHLGGPQRLSRYEMGLALANLLKVDQSLVLGKRRSEVSLSVPRPADVSLICQKANAADFHARNFSEGIQSTLKRYENR